MASFEWAPAAEAEAEAAAAVAPAAAACANGNTTVVRLLVEAGADQRMRSREGLDAFGIALAAGNGPVCELLQPTRTRLLSTFSSLNTVDAFMRARQDLTPANVEALERELTRAGVLVARRRRRPRRRRCRRRRRRRSRRMHLSAHRRRRKGAGGGDTAPAARSSSRRKRRCRARSRRAPLRAREQRLR